MKDADDLLEIEGADDALPPAAVPIDPAPVAVAFPTALTAEPVELTVPAEQAGARIDQFLAQQFPLYSRVLLRKVINAAAAKVDGVRVKAAHRLRGGERITVHMPDLPSAGPRPEEIPLSILYEDEHLAAIDKPPGMVVHPAKGHWSGTLTSALQFHFNQLSGAGGKSRPGIVHRLDRDTSGVLVVAKSDPVHLALARQFEERSVEKEYMAIVVGAPNMDRDLIDLPIGPHPYQREKMAIRKELATSRPAQTFFEVAERFKGYAALNILPKTGRTHQIRLHLVSIGCPVLCDRLYGGRAQITEREIASERTSPTAEDAVLLERQALHARRLKIKHPITGAPLEFLAPLPDDLTRLLSSLRRHRAVQ